SQPDSIIPSLGASGAISGVMAGYLVLFPTNRVKVILTLGVIFLRPFMVPAVVMIGIWALLQFVNGIGSIAVTDQTSGVAFWAHIGGFIAGAVRTLLAGQSPGHAAATPDRAPAAQPRNGVARNVVTVTAMQTPTAAAHATAPRAHAMKPPMCAQYAPLLVCSVTAIDPMPFTNCSSAQIPIITTAGTMIGRRKTKPSARSTRTRFVGKRTRYPAITPLIAPD